MARRPPYRPTAAPTPTPEQQLPLAARGGPVHRLYLALEPADREAVIDKVGLKHCQRIGHRHKVTELRALGALADGWATVDAWIAADDPSGGPKAFGDLLQPLLAGLIDRARDVLGDNADEPSTDDLAAMAEAMAGDGSVVEVRLLLAAVVEFEFTAAPQALELGERDQRLAIV